MCVNNWDKKIVTPDLESSRILDSEFPIYKYPSILVNDVKQKEKQNASKVVVIFCMQ